MSSSEAEAVRGGAKVRRESGCWPLAVVGAVVVGAVGVGFAVAPDSGAASPDGGRCLSGSRVARTVSCATDTTPFPSPTGTARCAAPRLAAHRSSVMGGRRSRGRYHQASDMSLNLWILMPIVLVLGLWVAVSRRLSKGRAAMRAPKVIFDIVLLALYLVAANPALTGVPFHEYLGAGIFVLMVAHVVASGEGLGGRGRWAQRVLNGALLVALAFCVVSGAHGVGDAAAFFGLLCDGLLFLGPIACPIRQGAARCPARPYCLAHAGCRIGTP